MNDFKGHSRDVVKSLVRSYKNVSNVSTENCYNLCAFEIMAGGITPKAQPIDAFLGKLFKGHYRNYYDNYMLNVPENSKGHPMVPSRQLCAQWVVKAWNKVSVKLIQKSWEVCGYKNICDLENTESSVHDLVQYETNKIIRIIESVAGSDALYHFLNLENKIGTPDDDENNMIGTWDII